MCHVSENAKPLKTKSEDFRSAIYHMNNLAVDGFEGIESVAGMAMKSLENGMEYAWELDHIYRALAIIKERAQSYMNSIDAEAELAGCKDSRILKGVKHQCALLKRTCA